MTVMPHLAALTWDDKEQLVHCTKGAGICFSSGLDLHFLRKVSEEPRDWDRPTPTVQMAETLRGFPRVMIAQVHGYCLGGALGIMNCHDIVFAAEDAQLGMPEVLRGSFGQLVTSTLLHSGLPVKKLALIALGGRNVLGKEADALGIVSQAVPAADERFFHADRRRAGTDQRERLNHVFDLPWLHLNQQMPHRRRF